MRPNLAIILKDFRFQQPGRRDHESVLKTGYTISRKSVLNIACVPAGPRTRKYILYREGLERLRRRQS